MVATPKPTPRDIRAAAKVRLKLDIFDARMSQLGATKRGEQAQILDMDRTALGHIISGRNSPSLERAIDMSARLDLTVEELFERAA